MKYAISTSLDYADEFDYPIFSVISEEKRNYLLSNEFKEYFEKIGNEYSFGTNECLGLGVQDIIGLVECAKPITDKELAVLKKFLMYGLDIIKNIEFEIIDFLRDNEDEADSFFNNMKNLG